MPDHPNRYHFTQLPDKDSVQKSIQDLTDTPSVHAVVRTVAAFDRYVEWQFHRGHGVSLDRREYRGLMPRPRLILTQKGSAFELSTKRCVNFGGESVDYVAADSLQSLCDDLVSSGRARIGVTAATAGDARSQAASWLTGTR